MFGCGGYKPSFFIYHNFGNLSNEKSVKNSKGLLLKKRTVITRTSAILLKKTLQNHPTKVLCKKKVSKLGRKLYLIKSCSIWFKHLNFLDKVSGKNM